MNVWLAEMHGTDLSLLEVKTATSGLHPQGVSDLSAALSLRVVLRARSPSDAVASLEMGDSVITSSLAPRSLAYIASHVGSDSLSVLPSTPTTPATPQCHRSRERIEFS